MQKLILNLQRWMSIWHESCRLLVQPNVLWNTRALQESRGWPGHHIRERQGESQTSHGLTTADVTSHLQVVVHGFMESDSYSPLLNISVIPQVTYRLAPAIWNKLYNYDQNLYGSGSSASSRTGESEAACLALVILVMATTTSWYSTLHTGTAQYCQWRSL